jgi:Ca-activated chloride channel family protein
MQGNSYDRDFQRDRDGNFVVTRLNEQMLKEIADAGNGKYYRANSPDMGLNSMLADLNKLNKTGSEYSAYSEYEEQFPGVIWIALALLLLEIAILEKKNKIFRKIKMFENQNSI